MFLIFITAEKIVASKLDCNAKIKFLTFSKYGFSPKETLGFEFPLWVVLPLLFVLITRNFLWTAILNFDIEPKKTKIRKKFVEVTENEIAKVAVSGPLALLIFGLIMRLINLNYFAYLCAFTAFLFFLPIGQGVKIYAGMRITGIFLFILCSSILLLMPIMSLISTLIISLIIAIALIIVYYSTWER
ncbi:MAG: hypothetical protein NZ889_00215 [Candidatus Pacearchaeota archaeon]|nr:hypothetical protein [Candidatus Pacearchaeota archaeon]